MLEHPISIHALREEGDARTSRSLGSYTLFLSTPSARKATLLELDGRDGLGISIHALREEGDLNNDYLFSDQYDFYPRPPRGRRPNGPKIWASTRKNFYPRPPRGRRPASAANSAATQRISIHALREEGDVSEYAGQYVQVISIHALREEGDSEIGSTSSTTANFYPRPPRGRRRCGTSG